ncbi:hypothetical protein GCM10010377_29060 [Streptomyces viridiviolaceus]|nr:hypothetical protein GCM10010377_29060 [Streptomyces viridiviolaceus]
MAARNSSLLTPSACPAAGDGNAGAGAAAGAGAVVGAGMFGTIITLIARAEGPHRAPVPTRT